MVLVRLDEDLSWSLAETFMGVKKSVGRTASKREVGHPEQAGSLKEGGLLSVHAAHAFRYNLGRNGERESHL